MVLQTKCPPTINHYTYDHRLLLNKDFGVHVIHIEDEQLCCTISVELRIFET